MFSYFDGLINATKKKKILSEYKKIIGLEQKREKLNEKFGFDAPSEISVTQKDILRNNFADLAKLSDELEIFSLGKKEISNIIKNYKYFNIQGSKTLVCEHNEKLNFTKLDDCFGGEVKLIVALQDNIIANEKLKNILDIFENSMFIRNRNIKKRVKLKILYLAKQKLIRNIKIFSMEFLGNEKLILNYIMSGMSGLDEDDHWHDYRKMKTRLKFCTLLFSALKINDSEYFEIAGKDLICLEFTSIDYFEVEKLLKKFKTKKYNFILRKIKQKGGNISD